MANKMLIDATHPEETRVVVLRGNRVEEFDFESAQRKQLRGNIYLAKVTRVEPSLQAAFVDYGGNRHGFLAFSEIHPDYYQIPVADRQALIEEEELAQRAAEDEADRRSRRNRRRAPSSARKVDEVVRGTTAEIAEGDAATLEHRADDIAADAGPPVIEPADDLEAANTQAPTHVEISPAAAGEPPPIGEPAPLEPEPGEQPASMVEAPPVAMSGFDTGASATAEFDSTSDEIEEAAPTAGERTVESAPVPEDRLGADDGDGDDDEAAEEVIESVGGADAMEEVPDRAPRYRRQYKIQEVIKRRQVLLVQVVKEERGTKGAALTTYLSLAGRYSVLMPNTARGGGISRKITSAEDRSRLKEIAAELEVPEGMGVILRTAGASRTKTEIKRDFEYLLRLWETVRDLTLRSTAPKLVYEEGSLVKRSIRDLYSKDIEEVIVAGSEAYHEAKDFMRMLMPSHAKNVKPYTDAQPLLSRYGVENQLDAMFSPVVQLRSGGYVVLNQAEALVAIDVNSGRATREHHIEDTALKTNLEAADEIARQLRLRDLAGLIVIDFIDMEEKRNNRAVERRLKECLKLDRARIQVGRISHFGLLEMSRQRIRASVLESSTEKCPYCGGTGHVRSVSSLALQVLRALEEQLMKGATHNLIARTRPDVALYVLNQKRAHLRALEERFAITITVTADESVTAPQAFAIDRGEQVHTIEDARALVEQSEATAGSAVAAPLEDEDDLEEPVASESEAAEAAESATGQGEEPGTRRRRRRRRRGRNGGHPSAAAEPGLHEDTAASVGGAAAEFAHAADEGDEAREPASEHAPDERAEARGDGERRRRRRGRRGGRRNRQERDAVRNGSEAAHSSHPDDHPPADEFAPDELIAPVAAESGLTSAVADLDAPSPAPVRHAAEPVATEAGEPSAPAAEAEPTRRRSTVREPAPVAGTMSDNAIAQPIAADLASPASPAPATPVAGEAPDGEDAAPPRRTGWWSRRFAGG